MRENMGKYRGLRVHKGNGTDFVYGFYVYNEPLGEHRIQTPSGGYTEVTPETVGQSTGLRDKNGKEVFEGDVCDYRGSIKSVKFGGGYADIKGSGHGEDWSEIPTSFSIGGEPLGIWNCLIIGTIHTTPELLEGGES